MGMVLVLLLLVVKCDGVDGLGLRRVFFVRNFYVV
jgi:hypothetical protein